MCSNPEAGDFITVRHEQCSNTSTVLNSRTSLALNEERRGVEQGARVTANGVVEVVADEASLLADLDGVDLNNARLLARLASFWVQQAE